MNIKSVLSEVTELLESNNIFDSKLNTLQHIVPMALLKNFKKIDGIIAETDFYNLDETNCIQGRDAADRLLTHLESNCIYAVNQFLQKIDPDMNYLPDLVCSSKRKSIRERHCAMFYLYIASLILRTPLATSFKVNPSLERKYLFSHKNVKYTGLDTPTLKLQRFSRLSPLALYSLTKKLINKPISVYTSKSAEFTPGIVLGHRLTENARENPFDGDYLVFLRNDIVLVFEDTSISGPHVSIKEATYAQISAINQKAHLWQEAATRIMTNKTEQTTGVI